VVRRRVLLAGIVAALAAPSLAGGYLLGQNAGGPDTNGLEHAMRVSVYIYKNGELVYYDPDDPATKQLTQLIAELIAGNIVGGIHCIGGGTMDKIYSSNHPGYVFVSYDNTPYSYTMYNLPNNYESASISTGGVTFNDSEKSVTFSASINIQTGGNITAVGLYTELRPDAYTDCLILLFYDVLSAPIQVQAGDVVTVVYKIVAP
jgi:hypothetical protein